MHFTVALLLFECNAVQMSFDFGLKMSILGDSFMFCGKLFQSKGAEYLNEQVAKVLCLSLGIARVVPLLFDLMLSCFSLSIVIKFLRYCDACPLMHL